MMQSRHIVRSVLCCLLCLTVCAVPALAGNEQYTDGLLYWQDKGPVITNQQQTFDFTKGYFPASISSGDADTITDSFRLFAIKGGTVSFAESTGSISWYLLNSYVEVLFPVPAPLTVTVSASGANCTIGGNMKLFGLNNGEVSYTSNPVYANRIDAVYDDTYVQTSGGSHTYNLAPGSHDIKRYFGYRYYFNTYISFGSKLLDWYMQLDSAFNGQYTFSDPNYTEAIYDKVIVNTGILQEINGKLTEIQTSTNQIKTDVSEIKNGLQDSNSSIWGAFKDSVSGLFVPSSAELEGVKNGFDQLAQDKLGGAYQTIDLVNGGVQSVVNKFKNPGSNPGVEFPGISVPLGGDVGTVTLAASQTVTIPEQITNVLYPVAGVIIPIVCVIWTIRQCTDMVECFMSGMSYAEFLHRNSDEEDNEV